MMYRFLVKIRYRVRQEMRMLVLVASTGVHRQVEFLPDAALFLTVFFHLPLPFTEDF